MTAGLPDGCHGYDLPGCSPAEELMARHWAQSPRDCEAQARDQIAAACLVSGPTRDWYLDWIRDFGIIKPDTFARLMQRQDSTLWTERVAAIFAQQVQDERDSYVE